MTIKDQTIAADASVREALQVMDAAQTKIVVVVSADDGIIRTITDGDIRRGLLVGADLSSPVALLPGRKPVVCPANSDAAAIIEKMREEQVHAVVMVDDDNRPVALADRAAMQGMLFMSPPHIGDAELGFVKEAFEANWIAPAGPNVSAFEAQLTAVSGRKHALALSSGTAALHLALRVLGVRRGHRVYCSDLTFVASIQPALYDGAVPVLIDSEPDSWNMSPDALARMLKKDAAAGTLPSAIIVVHIYGQPADMAAIMPIADEYGIPVIEDAAESLGATLHNRPSGHHGVLAAYSFNGNKIITTSGGGALVGDDAALIEHARKLSTQGRDPYEHYQHSEVAYNYRMSNILAGVGRGQIEELESRVEARRAIFDRYRKELGDIEGIGFQAELDGATGNRWLTVITLHPDHIDSHPYQFMRALREAGFETRPGWKPMHMQPLCSEFHFEPHSDTEAVSSKLFLQCLCLPSGSSMRERDQDQVIRQIRKLASVK